jgi:hypothetical protein
MLEQIAQVMNPMPPLRARKRPWLAFVLVFLFSGIALGPWGSTSEIRSTLLSRLSSGWR